MSSRARLLAAVSAIVAILFSTLALASGADAAASGRIESIDSSGGKVTVVFGGTDLGNDGVDPASVQMTLDGQPVPAKASVAGTSGQVAVKRTALIVLDTSGSMAGNGIAAAKAAANAFLATVPADVSVGLITFSDQPHVTVAPTTDRGAVRAAVSRLHAQGETALYDAINLALQTIGSSGARNILVLSDGGDTRSKASLQSAAAAISTDKVALDAVGFRTAESQNTVLQQLAAAGSGKVFTGAQAAAIAEAFTETAKSIANQLVVTASVPKSLADRSVNVVVSALAGSVRISDSTAVHLSAAPPAPAKPQDFGPAPVKLSRGATMSKTAFYGSLGALFAGLVVLIVVAASSARRLGGQSQIRRRLSVYTLSGKVVEERKEQASILGDSAVARSAMELAGRVVAKRDFESKLAQKLEAAAIPLKPAEWLLIHAIIAFGTGIVLLLVSAGRPLWALIGLVLGAIGPLIYLAVKESRRSAAFLAQLPDTLTLMAGSLTAGYSLPQAVDAVVREGSEPIVSEFNRALVEARLGVPIEDALESIGDRMASQDFSWVVMAIRIQREVGGNLAEILTIVANTLRERERLRRQVKVLSAEGRLSGVILTALPPLFALYMLAVRPTYIKPLFHEFAGLVLVAIGATLMVVGGLWMRKVVKVEV